MNRYVVRKEEGIFSDTRHGYGWLIYTRIGKAWGKRADKEESTDGQIFRTRREALEAMPMQEKV